MSFEAWKNDSWPAIFISGSCAELHHASMRKVLLQMHTARTGVVADPNDDALVATLVRENPQAVNQMFYQRTQLFFEQVLPVFLGVDRRFVVFEFAPSRGMVHFHCFAYRSDNRPHGILPAEGKEGLRRFFEENGFSCQLEGDYGSSLWPEKEGTRTAAQMSEDKKVLQSAQSGLDFDDLAKRGAFIRSVLLHWCSRYCTPVSRTECKFGFGDAIALHRKALVAAAEAAVSSAVQEAGADGAAPDPPARRARRDPEAALKLFGAKKLHDDFVVHDDGRGGLEAEVPRNHPRVLQCPVRLAQTWCANLDARWILASVSPFSADSVERLWRIVDYVSTRPYTLHPRPIPTLPPQLYLPRILHCNTFAPQSYTANPVLHTPPNALHPEPRTPIHKHSSPNPQT